MRSFDVLLHVAMAFTIVNASMPVGPPLPAPTYMVDNTRNSHGVAPDKGSLNGPVLSDKNSTSSHIHQGNSTLHARADGYWLANIKHGQMPFAGSGYKFYRNVKDYGAVGDGKTDDTKAINRAVVDGDRCGKNCDSTTIKGGLVYFPPGTYLISTPIIQYYYTQFVGDPNNRPVIKGSSNFKGIALIDTDVYIPEGSGAQWWVNQNNFYRQIRNFVFDLMDMKSTNYDAGQQYAPTGIHWQVAQATSLQNLKFNMPVSSSSGSATAVGIYMENGSGGFVSDLVFNGGNIGFRAGTQQFTATNLRFTNCLTAVSTIWNWGFTWKNMEVTDCYIAIDCTSAGGLDNQGTGSIAIIDSHFKNVPYAITITEHSALPNVVLENLLVEGNTPAVVLVSGGATILEGTTGIGKIIASWAMGNRYVSTSGEMSSVTGYLNNGLGPLKPQVLLDGNNNIFTRSKPQYEDRSAGDFVVATDHRIKNDATGDQTGAINSMLSANVGRPIFFPAGIYTVQGTVKVPVGSIIVGEGWSQIMAVGSYFGDQNNPKVMVQVGEPGDKGILEISDMLFTVKGAVAGTILMEWNVHESTQGSAGMWDSHFRVGGAKGTDLQHDNCPAETEGTTKSYCVAASMLLHITSQSSGYFENIWAWVADHDLDPNAPGLPTLGGQVSIYSGRGILIESQGPVWMYGTASEHNVLYQYQLSGASNVYMGHLQTESPYFQTRPAAPEPIVLGHFPNDPSFSDCHSDSKTCALSWGVRILNSIDIMIYSAGVYSWYDDYSQICVPLESCQDRIFQTEYTERLWIFNLFTKGAVEAMSPGGGLQAALQKDTQSGYTTEISAWLELSGTGGDIGDAGSGNGEKGIVYIDPSVWNAPEPLVQCQPPCTLILPPLSLGKETTISFPLYTTSIKQTYVQTRTSDIFGTTTTIIGHSIDTISTAITIPPVTTDKINVWRQTFTSDEVGPETIEQTSSIDIPLITITVYVTKTIYPGSTTVTPVTSTITLPPYPWSQITKDLVLNTRPTSWYKGNAYPTCASGCGHKCKLFCSGPCLFCPPNIEISGGGGGSGGGGDEDGEDEECSIRTASSCSTQCVGASCTTSCATKTACSARGTNTAATALIAPAYYLTAERWPTPTDETNNDAAADADVESMLASDFPSQPPDNGRTPTTAAIESASTAPSAEPISPDTSGFIFITSGTKKTTSGQHYTWLVLNDHSVSRDSMCFDQNIVLAVEYQGQHPTRPLYPLSLPAFDVGTHGSCTYRRTPKISKYSLICADGVEITCAEIEYPAKGFNCKNDFLVEDYDRVYPKLRCKYS